MNQSDNDNVTQLWPGDASGFRIGEIVRTRRGVIRIVGAPPSPWRVRTVALNAAVLMLGLAGAISLVLLTAAHTGAL